MSAEVEIARCPEHGLHGDRHKCFVCGGPVERVRMVPVAALEARDRRIAELEAALVVYADGRQLSRERGDA